MRYVLEVAEVRTMVRESTGMKAGEVRDLNVRSADHGADAREAHNERCRRVGGSQGSVGAR